MAALGLSCGTWDLHCGMRDLLVEAGMWDLVPQPGIEPRSPALGALSLNHWTTREVPQGLFFKLIIFHKNTENQKNKNKIQKITVPVFVRI